jgi:hypothetical protein
MPYKVFRSSLLMLSAVLAASCVMVMDEERDQPWPTAPESRKLVALEAGGTVAIEHTLGNIVISGWDKNSVEVMATGGEREPVAGRQVRVYTIEDLEPSIDIREAGGGLRIRTKSLGGPWPSGGLDYAIKVPNSVNLDAVRLTKGDVSVADVYGRMAVELGRGNLKISNFSGPLRASVESGRADVELLDVRGDDVIEITVGEGDIILRLEAGASVRIEAESPKGEITSDLDLGRALPARTLSGRLGGGEARVVLRALRGNIQILKTE